MASKKIQINASDKFLITLREASAYFSMGEKFLRRMAENNEGEFSFRYGNKYLFVRPSMEEYFMKMATNTQVYAPEGEGADLEYWDSEEKR